jgi:hypothetical protein
MRRDNGTMVRTSYMSRRRKCGLIRTDSTEYLVIPAAIILADLLLSRPRHICMYIQTQQRNFPAYLPKVYLDIDILAPEHDEEERDNDNIGYMSGHRWYPSGVDLRCSVEPRPRGFVPYCMYIHTYRPDLGSVVRYLSFPGRPARDVETKEQQHGLSTRTTRIFP